MPGKQHTNNANADATLTAFACPNEDYADFNRFGAGNLSVCEWIGKEKHIRRLYCCFRSGCAYPLLSPLRSCPQAALIRSPLR